MVLFIERVPKISSPAMRLIAFAAEMHEFFGA